jgi:hypothetical protein
MHEFVCDFAMLVVNRFFTKFRHEIHQNVEMINSVNCVSLIFVCFDGRPTAEKTALHVVDRVNQAVHEALTKTPVTQEGTLLVSEALSSPRGTPLAA